VSGEFEAVKEKPKEYASRIQVLDFDDLGNSEHECIGSRAVQEASREQRRFARKMDAASQEVKPEALWLWLDALTGEVRVYPRAASSRLESAYVNNRSNVPLAGLDKGIEDGIVHMFGKDSNQHPVQRSLQGGQMDVRRLVIQTNHYGQTLCINVINDGVWRIADVAVPGKTEERLVELNGSETVLPPSPPLPPISNPDRRCSSSHLRPWWEAPL